MTREEMEKGLAAYCDCQGSCIECGIRISNEVCDFGSMSDEFLKALYSVAFETLITDDLTGVVKEEPKTVTEILEEVSNKICDHYCKYPNEITDQEELKEKCLNCPLRKLN